jgi:hypothetical protein
MRRIIVICFFLLGALPASAAFCIGQTYNPAGPAGWYVIQIGGGGYVDGINQSARERGIET